MKLALLTAWLCASSLVHATSWFDGESVLELTLRGPLTSLLRNKQDRQEYPFELVYDGTTVNVDVRIRGHSRVVVCAFPPLRLNFANAGDDAQRWAGADKLKLVTHCQNGNQQLQGSLLNEYTAYRLFNVITPRSYRVRLLRIRYEDTDGKQGKLEEPHYGFFIESDDGLARRLGGNVAKVEALRFSELDLQQTARLNVFQYLIGNKDWSLVTADNDDTCCHNIDLLRVDDALVPVPYDFDLAAITRARYRSGSRLNRSRRREYSGYCRTPSSEVQAAIAYVQQLQDKILSQAQSTPTLDTKLRQRRVEFIADYFEQASDPERMMNLFERNCVGRR